MKRQAFLLGFFSTGGQILLLRELVSSFNGNELLIGIAFFGWMIAIALGAIFGGRIKIKLPPTALFIIGAIILPGLIIDIRLIPLLLTTVIGEVIPFSTAALCSMALMIPIGFVSGRLFTAIARREHRPAASVVVVYLFEGLGAFVGGAAITALIGVVFSTLAMSLAIGAVVVILLFESDSRPGILVQAVLLMAVLVLIWFQVSELDLAIDRHKYRAYRVEKTFDTHYSHQTILSRENTFTLLTDNMVEAVYPDQVGTENTLIPPLLYHPGIKRILIIGRAEFGIRQLAGSLTGLMITAVDPRPSLDGEIDRYLPADGPLLRDSDDPLKYFIRHNSAHFYDLIILNPGPPDNYRNGRFLTERFLGLTKTLLKSDGILYYPSDYDTDRYISPEKKELLTVIFYTLEANFRHVHIWPGEKTLFLASDSDCFKIPAGALFARIDSLGYMPQYINQAYLADRLNELRVDRLEQAVSEKSGINTIEKPILEYLQAIYRSQTGPLDRNIVPYIFKENKWVIFIPGIILLLFLVLVMGRQKRRRFGLFLYFTAGVVSLSLELIAFYLYQATAGSLYAEMSILIGVFMLGLSLGTYYSYRINKENLEFPALLLLLTAAVILLVTHHRINPGALLFYHIFFLFTVALATGSLFVAATDRYYYGRAEVNRGIGYAMEILGSAIGALLTTTILLPLIGLPWLLGAIIIILILSLVGAIITAG
nr:hypothetical protein [candidate division Zixibacteria bacterium]